ncbi:MAG: response regulator [Gammaproteobacteria bacterium]|nr:response regulator [Gammaproteobacteria bacterium]
MKSDHEKFLSTRAAAVLLGVSLRTVQLWVENGTLVAWKTAGGHRRIPEQSVKQIIEQRKANRSGGTNKKELLMLIVEDDAEVRDAYCLSIAMMDFPIKLMTADNGFEGLIKAGKYHPDVIMTDLMMPNMDGFEMINAINKDKDLNPDKLIVVTAMDKNNNRVQLLQESDVALFNKPLDINKLEEILKQQIREKQYA